MFKKFALSIRNILLYRAPQPYMARHLLREVQSTRSTREFKDLITAIVLKNVGLKLNGESLSGIYFTKCQRDVIERVKAFGYKPGI